ncbi:hypothetical protein [Algoriphagus sp.]|uniref:hypothetical protein n=1 Tax=Algoriphagus sp. TaxID=1872435 RepID=UPI003272E4A2
MKTAIFTWLFLLPIQIFAGSHNSRFTEENLENTPEKTQEMMSEKNSQANLATEDFQELAASLQNDVQKLKSELAHKNHEINSQELTQWKSQSATLTFFVGMLIFAFLYIRNKRHNDQSELLTIHNYNPEK